MNKKVLGRAVAYINSWLRYKFDRTNLTGLVVAIAHENELLFRRAYGFANLERQEPMTVDHIFRIASHSKTFAATSIMQLAEKGSLDIDDPIVDYLPWLKEHQDARMQLVTARQLMSHSAGFLRDGTDPNYWELSFPFPDAATFKRDLMKSSLVIDSGSRMKYSNFAYTLIGLLIEEVSGMSFQEYVSKHILALLGTEETGPEFTTDILPRLVTGYSRLDAQKERLPIDQTINTHAMASATGFYSTAIEMCEYFNSQFVGSGVLLNDESKKEMHRTQWQVPQGKNSEEYGLGIEIDYTDERRLFGHGGGFPGQRTRTFCHQEDKLIVVVLCNCVDVDTKEIGKGIYTIIDHFKKSDEESDPKTIEHLRKFQGRVSYLWGDYDFVECGTKLIAIDPNAWFPFGAKQDIQELELVDATANDGNGISSSTANDGNGGTPGTQSSLGNTFKITKVLGYGSEGELVKFHFNAAGTIASVDFAGHHMLPEADYENVMARKKSEGLGITL